MGNQNFLEEMKDANHCPTAKQFDLEDMIQEEFLQDMFQKFYDGKFTFKTLDIS